MKVKEFWKPFVRDDGTYDVLAGFDAAVHEIMTPDSDPTYRPPTQAQVDRTRILVSHIFEDVGPVRNFDAAHWLAKQGIDILAAYSGVTSERNREGYAQTDAERAQSKPSLAALLASLDGEKMAQA